MGLPCCKCSCFAGAGSLPNNLDVSSPNCDADPRGINSPVGSALSLSPHAGRANGSSVPSFVAKDAIGFGDGIPALNIAKGAAVGVPGFDMLWVEFCLEKAHLAV